MSNFIRTRMSPVQFIYVCCAVFVASLISIQASAESSICAIDEILKGPLAKRAGAVTFPDGRTITVVGHAHGDTKIILGLQQLASDLESSNDHFIEDSRRRLQELHQTVNDFKQDAEYLLAQLKEKKIRFVAMEAGEGVLAFFHQNTAALWVEGKKNLARRKLSQAQILEDAVLAFGGPARFIKVLHPEHRDSYKIIGVENDRLMQESLDALDEAFDQKELIKNRLPENHPFRKNIDDIFNSAWARYAEDIIPFTDEQILLSFLASVPHEIYVQAPTYMRAVLRLARLLRERDERTTPKLMANEGSGIYFVGEVHRVSQQKLLREACLRSQQNLAQPSATIKR